jgi:hypothetical protein
MIAYKLVRCFTRFTSFTAPSNYEVVYAIGKATIADPKTIGLFCFTSIDAAKLFAERQHVVLNGKCFTLFEAEVVPKAKPSQFMCSEAWSRGLDAFYRGDKSASIFLPSGTVLCSEVTLLREIVLENT